MDQIGQRPGYWDQLTTGVSNGLWNSTFGMAEYVYRPSKIVETVKGLYFVATHPLQSAYALGNAFYEQPVKEISELVTGIWVGQAVGKVISYATRTENIERLNTVVQKLVVSQEATDKLNKLSNLINYFTDLEKNPALYNAKKLAKKAKELKKLASTAVGSASKSHLGRIAHHISKAENAGAWYHTNKAGKLAGRLGKIADHAMKLEQMCSLPIQSAGQKIIEIVTTVSIPTQVLKVSPDIAGAVANCSLLVQNMGRALPQLPREQGELPEQPDIQQPPVYPQPPLQQQSRMNEQKFVNLQSVVEDYTLGIRRLKSGELPRPLHKIKQVIEDLQISKIDFRQKILQIITIAESMGNQHPIAMAARKCLVVS